ncbi:MAG: cation diffusion facilitator family transporter [Clostridia bacterium]|nr:cation diffusion facilitator family transporter [Clostridia bacterium]
MSLTNLLINKFIPNHENKNDPAVREKFGVLSGVVGILCNVVISIGKFFVGIATSSIAVSADAFNNISDAVSSVITLICFKTSGNPADKDHPFGHGRIEYISGLIVSVAIIFTGVEFTKSSIEKVFDPEPVSSGFVPILILLLSLFVKLWLGLFNKKAGAMINSAAMKATAFDSILDCVITLTILVGMLITYCTGVSIDAYTGVVVALFIIFTGVSMIKETINPLLGQAPDDETIKTINEIVLSYPDVLGIHELLVHNYGPGRSAVSFHAEMPANKNIMELHEEIEDIEKKLKNKFGYSAIIHMDPVVTDDEHVVDMKEKLSKIIKLVHKNAQIYDLRIIPGNQPTLIFHISVPYYIIQKDSEIKSAVELSIKALDPKYKCIIEIDRIYFESQPLNK